MTTQNHLSAGLKKSYDIELTRELCPPKETYQTCKFKKRLVVHKDKIHIIDPITGEPLQPREEINLTQNVIENYALEGTTGSSKEGKKDPKYTRGSVYYSL